MGKTKTGIIAGNDTPFMASMFPDVDIFSPVSTFVSSLFGSVLGVLWSFIDISHVHFSREIFGIYCDFVILQKMVEVLQISKRVGPTTRMIRTSIATFLGKIVLRCELFLARPQSPPPAISGR